MAGHQVPLDYRDPLRSHDFLKISSRVATKLVENHLEPKLRLEYDVVPANQVRVGMGYRTFGQ